MGGMPAEKLNDAQVQQELKNLPGWELKNGEITRFYTFKGFPEAVAFVNRILPLAEAADHHPGIDIRYNKVRLTLSTHSAGGLTAKDFDLARTIGS